MPWDSPATPPPSRPPRGASPAASGETVTQKKKKKKKSSKKPVDTPKKLVSEASVSLATHMVADALESHEIEIYVGQGHLGLVLCDHPLGVMVQAAEPFDLAYMSGLRKGDVITTIQDRRVSRHAAAAAILFEQANAAERTSLFGVINRAPLRLMYYAAIDCDRFLQHRRSLPRLATIDASQGGQPGLTLASHPLGVVVLDVVPGDLGARAGLCIGDVLVTLNGRAVLEHQVAAQTLEDCAAARVTMRMTSYSAEAAAIELILTNPSYGPTSETTATARRPLTTAQASSQGMGVGGAVANPKAILIPWDAKSETASSKRDASALATYKYAAEPPPPPRPPSEASGASISSSRRAASAAAGAAARAAAGTTAAAVDEVAAAAGADNLLTPADASYAASWHEKEVIAGRLSEIVASKKGARASSPAGKGGSGSSRGAARAWVRAAPASSVHDYVQTIQVL